MCGLSIGPVEKRNQHQRHECPLRHVVCRHGCQITELTAQVRQEHEDFQCGEALVPCPFACGRWIARKNIQSHMHPISGDCMERLVRCPSNLVGWRVSVAGEKGIVMKYRRFSPESSTSNNVLSTLNAIDGNEKTQPGVVAVQQLVNHSKLSEGGKDRLYIRFENKQIWIDLWGSIILPLEKVVGAVAKGRQSAGLVCGWLPFNELESHLVYDCPHRAVWVGGNVKLDSETHEFKGDLIGQISTFENVTQVAALRSDIDNFLSAEAPVTWCEYCSVAVTAGTMERHLRSKCMHYVIRCTLGCGARLARREMEQHVLSCRKRNILCQLCNQNMWAEEVKSQTQILYI